MNKMVLGHEYEWPKNITCTCVLCALFGVPHPHFYRSTTYAFLCFSESGLATLFSAETGIENIDRKYEEQSGLGFREGGV